MEFRLKLEKQKVVTNTERIDVPYKYIVFFSLFLLSVGAGLITRLIIRKRGEKRIKAKNEI